MFFLIHLNIHNKIQKKNVVIFVFVISFSQKNKKYKKTLLNNSKLNVKQVTIKNINNFKNKLFEKKKF